MLIQSLAVAILALVTLPNGEFAPWFAGHPNGAQHHAESLAEMTVEAARYHGIDPHLLTALIWRESSFNSRAMSSKGAFGLAQLSPKYHRDIRRMCREKIALCDWLVINRGARELAWYLRKCHGDSRGVHAYRTGRCGPPGPETQKVLSIRRWLINQTGDV